MLARIVHANASGTCIFSTTSDDHDETPGISSCRTAQIGCTLKQSVGCEVDTQRQVKRLYNAEKDRWQVRRFQNTVHPGARIQMAWLWPWHADDILKYMIVNLKRRVCPSCETGRACTSARFGAVRMAVAASSSTVSTARQCTVLYGAVHALFFLRWSTQTYVTRDQPILEENAPQCMIAIDGAGSAGMTDEDEPDRKLPSSRPTAAQKKLERLLGGPLSGIFSELLGRFSTRCDFS